MHPMDPQAAAAQAARAARQRGISAPKRLRDELRSLGADPNGWPEVARIMRVQTEREARGRRFVDAHAHAIVRHLHQTGHDPAARLISYDDPGYDRVWCDSDAAPHRGISPDGRPMLQVETKLSANELHRIAERLGLSLSAWEIRR